MSKTWEHDHHAARHHERAAYHFNEAAKYDQGGEQEKAAHHAYMAHGHNQYAIHNENEAAKLYAERGDGKHAGPDGSRASDEAAE